MEVYLCTYFVNTVLIQWGERWGGFDICAVLAGSGGFSGKTTSCCCKSGPS
jgi:hypothetical protein